MGNGSGKKYSRLYSERRNTKRKVEGKSRFEGMGVREEIERGKERTARISWEEMRKRAKKSKVLGGWEEERKEF